MIEHLLFPVDFSPSCSAMAAFVKRAAAMFGAEVTLLHVCDLTSHDGFELYARPVTEIAEEHRGLARDRLDEFLLAEFPGAECPRLLLSGDPAAHISQCARDGQFDLIVMPTHACRFRRMFLGSTTAKVLTDADCPVLTTQHAETVVPRPLEHRVWVCGLSLGEDSERILRQASEAVKTVGAKLQLIHVLDSALRQPPAGSGQHPAERQARARIEGLQQATGSTAEVSVVIGGLEEVLLTAAREADVLIIGRKAQTDGHTRITTLAYDMIRDSPCPVLSV